MVYLFVFYDVLYEINNFWNWENFILMIYYVYIRMFMYYIWYCLEFYYVFKENENFWNWENFVFMIYYVLVIFVCFLVV